MRSDFGQRGMFLAQSRRLFGFVIAVLIQLSSANALNEAA